MRLVSIIMPVYNSEKNSGTIGKFNIESNIQELGITNY